MQDVEEKPVGINGAVEVKFKRASCFQDDAGGSRVRPVAQACDLN
jgi:hypothetical protein